MNTKVFFLLAGVAVALAAPDRPSTSYGAPRESSSFEHFSPSSSSESFEHFSPSSSSDSFEHFSPSSSSDSFEHFSPSSSSGSFEHFSPSSSSGSFEHSGQDSSSFERYSAPSFSSSSDSSESYESYESEEAKYDFQWSVEDDSTANDFDHKETRDGDDIQGVYTVQLPDGRKQTVTYYVDGDTGYIADVKYEGVARYPDHSSESYESFESRSSESFESFESRSRESFESFGSRSDESFESRAYAPPSRSYSAPDSNESK